MEFFVGAFMTIGVGAYAPTFALVSMMGMNVQSAFPIMMGGCVFLMTFGADHSAVDCGSRGILHSNHVYPRLHEEP